MAPIVDGIGTPGTQALLLSEDERASLQLAVRESVHRQIVAMLRRRGISLVEQGTTCPRCGEMVIVLDQPSTFALDVDGERICCACRAERDFDLMVRPDADIGGEGG